MKEDKGKIRLKKDMDTNEFEATVQAINQLTEEDAKSLLRMMYGYINTAMTGNGGDSFKIEVVDKLDHMYKRIPELNRLREV